MDGGIKIIMMDDNIIICGGNTSFFYGFVDLTPEQRKYVHEQMKIHKVEEFIGDIWTTWYDGEEVGLDGLWFESDRELHTDLRKDREELFMKIFMEMNDDPDSDIASSPFLHTHIGAYAVNVDTFWR